MPNKSRLKLSLCKTRVPTICQISKHEIANTLHFLVGDAYYIWDVISHDRWHKLSHPVQLIKFSMHRGSGASGPWGCIVHILPPNPARPQTGRDTACSVLTLTVWAVYRGMSPPVSWTCRREYTHRFISASGQYWKLLRTCSCPFMYSTLINVKESIWSSRHDSCDCPLIRSWIWNHSDLIGSFYSNVSSKDSENLSWPLWVSLSRWEHFILPCYPLQ